MNHLVSERHRHYLHFTDKENEAKKEVLAMNVEI